MAIVEETKIIGKDGRVTIGREISIKLTDDDEVVIIQVRHKIGEHGGRIILILGGRIDAASRTEVLVKVGVNMEG
jgi:hypothetical protein